jgi:EF hand
MARDLLRAARATVGRLMEHGMFVLGSAASSAWDLLSSLQAQASAGAAAAGIGAGQFAPEGSSAPVASAGPTPFTPTPAGTVGQASLSPDVLGFLIWNQSQQVSPTGAAGTAGTTDATPATGSTALTPFQSALFSNLDANGDGSISKSEFETAFGANGNTSAADTLFSQIDTNGDGTIDPGEFATATQSSGAHGHHHHHAGFAGQSQPGQSDPLTSLFGTSADGAASSTATNADGSTTTTITYADGSAVTLTTPAQASSGGVAPATPATIPVQSSPTSVNVLETLIQLQAQLLAPAAAA